MVNLCYCIINLQVVELAMWIEVKAHYNVVFFNTCGAKAKNDQNNIANTIQIKYIVLHKLYGKLNY